MSSNQMDSENYKKLAQLCELTEEYLDRRYAAKILEQGYDIDYQAPADSFFITRKPDLIGSTALHLSMGNKDMFTYLLDNGADFTIKNAKGLTVLHQAVSPVYDRYTDNNWLQGRFESRLENDYATLVLDAHVRTGNPRNPRDENGISHLHVACMANDARAVEFFLRNGASIDQTVNRGSPIFSGFGPLHIAVKCNCPEVVDVLLRYGADAKSLKDAEGRTPLEVGVERNMEIVDWMHGKDSGAYYFLSLYSDIRSRENAMKLIVSQKVGAIGNCDLSCFHAVCTFSDTSLVEQFLKESCDVDESVEATTPLWDGYTALHFAAHFNFDSVKLLLQNGADIEAKDAHGVTPLDICEGRIRVKDVLFLVSSHSVWRNIVLSDGETRLTDLLCAMERADRLNEYFNRSKLNVNAFVPFDSPIWPGCTILHLAVTFTETFPITTEYSPWYEARENLAAKRRCRESTSTYLERLEVCLKRGADVTIQDADGRTPLTRAFRSNRMAAVKSLLEFHWNARNPTDRDNLSHLYVACYAEDDRVVAKLLSTGAEVNAPILPSFKWHGNESSFVQRYRSRGLRIAGSTPLHVVVAKGSLEITSALLKRGADVNARDCDGLTPIHKLLGAYRNADEIANLLFTSRGLKPCSLHGGLNYLHVAVHFGSLSAVERLIDMGVDVNASIAGSYRTENSSELQSFATRYSGCTPLHVNLRKSRSRHDISELLIRRGADIFIRNSAGYNSLHENLKSRYTSGYNDFVVSIVEKDPLLRKRMVDDSGLTTLHLACWKFDVRLVDDCLKRGEDANARVHLNSPIWPGWTPMHLLMVQSADMFVAGRQVHAVMRLLMDNGADLSLTNDEMATPLHLTEADERTMKIRSGLCRTYANSSFTTLLLRHTTTSSAYNRANVDGISHFHIACIRNDVEMIEKFLRDGADVNQPVNFFSVKYPGCTPLHLALTAEPFNDTSSRVTAVVMLLKYGANVHDTDTCGNTPVHTVVKYGLLRETLLEILISAGADINAINIFGETPLEVLLKSNNATSADIKLFLDYGCRVNAYNPINDEGYISQIITYERSSSSNLLLGNVLNSCDPFDVDAMGRTIIHNIVSTRKAWVTDYADILQRLIARGCDVDQQDISGRTALHNAVQFNNDEAVSGLLESGAEINLTDANGKTPLVRCLELFEECTEYTNRFHQQLLAKALATHVYKLQITGLCVNKCSNEIVHNLMKKSVIDKSKIETCRNEIEVTRGARIGSSVTLYDFLSDTGAVAAYPVMKYTERNAVDNFFKFNKNDLAQKKFKELNSLLNLQYRKAVKRQGLNGLGVNALNVIFSIPLPELCSRVVIRYLTNEDLKNVINAASSIFHESSFANM